MNFVSMVLPVTSLFLAIRLCRRPSAGFHSNCNTLGAGPPRSRQRCNSSHVGVGHRPAPTLAVTTFL